MRRDKTRQWPLYEQRRSGVCVLCTAKRLPASIFLEDAHQEIEKESGQVCEWVEEDQNNLTHTHALVVMPGAHKGNRLRAIDRLYRRRRRLVFVIEKVVIGSTERLRDKRKMKKKNCLQ